MWRNLLTVVVSECVLAWRGDHEQERTATDDFDFLVGTWDVTNRWLADTYNGTPIVARFRWSGVTPDSAGWEQAFSADGGQTSRSIEGKRTDGGITAYPQI